MRSDIDRVVVWGNCQAAPLADLLREPLAARGLRVVAVPPVYQVTGDELAAIYATLRKTALLIGQPISDEYRVPGCGTAQLAAQLPLGARVIRLPVVYDVGAFPFQARGYDASGARVDAPVTDYHDLRMVRAAADGWSTERTVAHWPQASAAGVHAVAAASVAELRRRETGLDVTAADLIGRAGAMWTMTHPANRTLADLARRVLDVLAIDGSPPVPEREYLGQRRAPVDRGVVEAMAWPADSIRPEWMVDGAVVPLRDLADEQLAWYAKRPGVVTATLRRAAARLALLDR